MTSTSNNATTTQSNNAFVGVGGPALMSSQGLFTTPDGTQASYRYAGFDFAPVATPTDWIVIQGSATKTCRIRSIYISGIATAAANIIFQVVRRLSTGGTIGSAVLTGITPGQCDINNAAPTAVLSTVGTANYSTVQTANGVLSTGRIQQSAVTTGVASIPYKRDYGKALLLRGTTDYICLNFNGVALPSGSKFDYEIVIEEDNS